MAKQELIAQLPNDINERKRLMGVINEAVQLKLQMQDLKESLGDIFVVEKEDHQYSPKFLKNLVNLEFSEQYEAQKKRIQIEELAEQVTELDILMGRGE
jgi:regulator of replication initiation timing